MDIFILEYKEKLFVFIKMKILPANNKNVHF